METKADISVLSSRCPEQGGDVCVSCVRHIIQLINITAQYLNQAVILFLSLFACCFCFLGYPECKHLRSKHSYTGLGGDSN